MDKVLAVIKEHPAAIGIGVVFLLLIMSMRGSSGATSSGGNNAAASVQSQSIATQGNVSIAGINAGVTVQTGAQYSADYQAALSVASKASATRAALISSIFDTTSGTQVALARNQTGADVATTLARFQHQDVQTQFADNLTLGQAAMQAGVTTHLADLNSTIQLNKDNNNAKLNALGQSITAQQYSENLTAANLPALLANSENIARITGNTQASLATIASQTAITQSNNNTAPARTAANASSTASNVSSFASIASVISDLFA